MAVRPLYLENGSRGRSGSVRNRFVTEHRSMTRGSLDHRLAEEPRREPEPETRPRRRRAARSWPLRQRHLVTGSGTRSGLGEYPQVRRDEIGTGTGNPVTELRLSLLTRTVTFKAGHGDIKTTGSRPSRFATGIAENFGQVAARSREAEHVRGAISRTNRSAEAAKPAAARMVYNQACSGLHRS